MAVPDAFASLVERAASAGVFTDFDGTLAQIVDDPAAARPLAGTTEVLATLATRYARVGVVSGRPVAFLRRHVGAPGVVLWGEYGLEHLTGDGISADPEAEQWRGAVEEARARAEAAGVAERVERKGLSFALHFREDPARRAAVERWAREETARSGLVLYEARLAIELRPPVARDKGTALASAAAGLDAACFIGDDKGDLAAFDALDRMAEAGASVVRVAVRSTEGPADLQRRADLVVDGPPEALALLEGLAAAVR